MHRIYTPKSLNRVATLVLQSATNSGITETFSVNREGHTRDRSTQTGVDTVTECDLVVQGKEPSDHLILIG